MDYRQANIRYVKAVASHIMLRLAGPPFTHPRIPDRAHYLGTYTPLTRPDEYIAALRHLINHYRCDIMYSSSLFNDNVVPLVINTQGWMKGLGEELLHAIETMAEPTHIYAFQNQTSAEDDFPDGGGWTKTPLRGDHRLPYANGLASPRGLPANRVKDCVLESPPSSPLQARYTPTDLRMLSMMSYLRADLGSSTWNFTLPMLALRPWQIELGTAIQQIYIIGEGAESIREEDLPLALNGSLVALLESTEPLGRSASVYITGRPYPAFDESNFLGLALIRGVERCASRIKLHLLTPLPPSRLFKAKILVKNGSIELPLCGWLDRQSRGGSDEGLCGKVWEDVPFLEAGGVEVIGGERRRFRRNLMRKGM